MTAFVVPANAGISCGKVRLGGMRSGLRGDDEVVSARDMPTLASRFARARFRAWHRGTREADLMIGGFFDRHHPTWTEADLAWFEELLDEDDVDVMAWALQAQPTPARFAGQMLQALEKLDYVSI